MISTAHPYPACTQSEVDAMFASAKKAQKEWARTPLWKRAEVLHKTAKVMRDNAQPMADCLGKLHFFFMHIYTRVQYRKY